MMHGLADFKDVDSLIEGDIELICIMFRRNISGLRSLDILKLGSFPLHYIRLSEIV
jgi:hypothetical protein